MREEPNPTMATADRTVCRIGITAQYGIQRDLIFLNKRKKRIQQMPIGPKYENFGDGDNKNARFSFKMWKLSCITSSYQLVAKSSSGGRGFLLGRHESKPRHRFDWQKRFTLTSLRWLAKGQPQQISWKQQTSWKDESTFSITTIPFSLPSSGSLLQSDPGANQGSGIGDACFA